MIISDVTSALNTDTRVACVCLSTNRGYAKKSWPIVDLYKRCLAVMCAPADTYLQMVHRPTTANLEMPSNTGKTCFEDADLHDINDNLSTGLFWSTYNISKSPADGHCFMHSVVTTFNANMSDNISVKLDVPGRHFISKAIYINYIEIINSDDRTGIPSLRHHVLEYVQHKNYNN